MNIVTVYVNSDSGRVTREERVVRENYGDRPVFVALDDCSVIPLVSQGRKLKAGDDVVVLYLNTQGGERLPLGVLKGRKYYACIIK